MLLADPISMPVYCHAVGIEAMYNNHAWYHLTVHHNSRKSHSYSRNRSHSRVHQQPRAHREISAGVPGISRGETTHLNNVNCKLLVGKCCELVYYLHISNRLPKSRRFVSKHPFTFRRWWFLQVEIGGIEMSWRIPEGMQLHNI